jgi:hypothetical protein
MDSMREFSGKSHSVFSGLERECVWMTPWPLGKGSTEQLESLPDGFSLGVRAALADADKIRMTKPEYARRGLLRRLEPV